MVRSLFLSIIAASAALGAVYDAGTNTISNDMFVMTLQNQASWSSSVQTNELIEIAGACIDYWDTVLGDTHTLTADNRITFTLDFAPLGSSTLGVANTVSAILAPSTAGLPNDRYYPLTNVTNGIGYNSITLSQQKLFNGASFFKDTTDFAINMNSSFDFYYGLDVPSTSTGLTDFYSVLLHEITHGMGFGSSLFKGNGEELALADSGVTDANGNTVYNISLFDTLILQNLTDQDPTEFTLGSKVQLGDDPDAFIYNPETYKQGSSISHIDASSDPDALMNFSIAKDVYKRELSALEIEVFQQMGYDMKMIPEPSSVILILTLLPAAAARRRRRAA